MAVELPSSKTCVGYRWGPAEGTHDLCVSETFEGPSFPRSVVISPAVAVAIALERGGNRAARLRKQGRLRAEFAYTTGLASGAGGRRRDNLLRSRRSAVLLVTVLKSIQSAIRLFTWT